MHINPDTDLGTMTTVQWSYSACHAVNMNV